MIRSILAAVLGVAAISVLAAPARADLVSGTITGVSTLTPTSTPGIYVVSFTGNGTDTTFGDFSVTSSSSGDFINPPNIVITDGMFSESFTGGGSLFGTSSGSGTANGAGSAALTLNYVVKGGSGAFAGDIGKIAITGTLTTVTATTEAFDGTYSGSLTATPEPAMFVPLAPMVLLLLWRIRSPQAG